MNNYFIELNSAINELHRQVQEFERKFWNEEDGEPEMICIEVIAVPAYSFYNFYLEVEVTGENNWTRKWHEQFCKTFGCKLKSIKKESIKTENNYADGFGECWIYTYEPVSWPDYRDLQYDDMMVVEFKRDCNWETVRLDLTINNDFTDSMCVSRSFYDALKEVSPNNSSLIVTEEVYKYLVESARNDRESGFIQFVSVGDKIRFKKWKR